MAIEINVSCNKDPNRIARAVQTALADIARNPRPRRASAFFEPRIAPARQLRLVPRAAVAVAHGLARLAQRARFNAQRFVYWLLYV